MSFGATEIVLILVIVLVLFGPSRLPSLGRSVGEAIRGFKKGIDGDEIDVTPAKQDKINSSRPDPVTQAQKQESKTTES